MDVNDFLLTQSLHSRPSRRFSLVDFDQKTREVQYNGDMRYYRMDANIVSGTKQLAGRRDKGEQPKLATPSSCRTRENGSKRGALIWVDEISTSGESADFIPCLASTRRRS